MAMVKPNQIVNSVGQESTSNCSYCNTRFYVFQIKILALEFSSVIVNQRHYTVSSNQEATSRKMYMMVHVTRLYYKIPNLLSDHIANDIASILFQTVHERHLAAKLDYASSNSIMDLIKILMKQLLTE